MDYDAVIIGGGVVGLACAARLSERNLRLLLLERHPSFGRETSSRNSEVIHAGIYYPKDSLKAKLCVPGNRSLYKWCEQKNIPHKRIGKYIVAVNHSEKEELENIFQRAKNNGVENIIHASLNRIKSDEPNVKAVAGLWSPDTGIVDSHSLMASFAENARLNGCDFAWKHKVSGINPIGNGYELDILDPENSPCKITTQYIINSAGLDSDLIAEMAGIDIDLAGYRIHFCRGHYFRIVPSKKGLVKHLIYPAPNKKLSYLGIHLTLELSGELKLGPDVEYLPERIQDYRVPENLREQFYIAVSTYLTGLDIDDIYPDQSGIRPKLQTEGGDFRDFIIKEESEKGLPCFINLIGIESPGLTSCLEIARIVNDYL
ncbi:MAG: hypothetical protein QG635_1069 [Bacteroidota bacterium]|nr:hypothetical protein [Bacteroidota bacterium]